jgi:putative FmdB family regulatory protein
MPLYEYFCNQCGHQEEVFQKMKDAPLTACPACQRETYQKAISLPSGKVRECKSAAELGLTIPSEEQMAQKKAQKEARTPWWRSGKVEGLPKKDKPVDVTKIDTDHYVQTGEERPKP